MIPTKSHFHGPKANLYINGATEHTRHKETKMASLLIDMYQDLGPVVLTTQVQKLPTLF